MWVRGRSRPIFSFKRNTMKRIKIFIIFSSIALLSLLAHAQPQTIEDTLTKTKEPHTFHYISANVGLVIPINMFIGGGFSFSYSYIFNNQALTAKAASHSFSNLFNETDKNMYEIAMLYGYSTNWRQLLFNVSLGGSLNFGNDYGENITEYGSLWAFSFQKYELVPFVTMGVPVQVNMHYAFRKFAYGLSLDMKYLL